MASDHRTGRRRIESRGSDSCGRILRSSSAVSQIGVKTAGATLPRSGEPLTNHLWAVARLRSVSLTTPATWLPGNPALALQWPMRPACLTPSLRDEVPGPECAARIGDCGVPRHGDILRTMDYCLLRVRVTLISLRTSLPPSSLSSSHPRLSCVPVGRRNPPAHPDEPPLPYLSRPSPPHSPLPSPLPP